MAERPRGLLALTLVLALSGCDLFKPCPAADPGYTYCGYCPNPVNCFYCPPGYCPADPCTATCDRSAGGGGGGGGGSGSCSFSSDCLGAAVCVSTRSCIASAMGNGCNCAGSTAGTCYDYSGTPAAGKPCSLQGAACGGNSPMCCAGDVCTNGRCEAPGGGRCPQ